MATKLTFEYDKVGDILHIHSRPSYPEQDSEELDDYVIARLNPKNGEIEGLEVLLFPQRLNSAAVFELPVSAELHATS